MRKKVWLPTSKSASRSSKGDETERPRQLIFHALLLCASVSVVIAQAATPTAQKRKLHHDGVIKSVYDAAKDQTLIALQRYRVYPDALARYGYQGVTIMAGFSFSGHTPTSPPKVVEVVMSTETARDWRFREQPELTAVVDAEPVSFGRMSVRKRFAVGGLNHEEVVARFTYDGLLRITNARSVVMRAGDVKFTVDKDLLEALRDLASRAVP